VSVIFSENRYPPRIKCGAGAFFGIMLWLILRTCEIAMRAAPFIACLLVLAATANPAAARTPWIEAAWPAPVGHFQPRAGDIPSGIPLSPSRAEQETLDRALDEKLRICRGC
jgi:hypothetical protein